MLRYIHKIFQNVKIKNHIVFILNNYARYVVIERIDFSLINIL